MDAKGEKPYSGPVVNEFKKYRPSLSKEINAWYEALGELAAHYGIETSKNQIPVQLEKKSLERLNQATKPAFFIVTGPGGVGKGTVKDYLPTGVSFVPNITSRKPRENEIEGRDYYFRTNDEIAQQVARGQALLIRNTDLLDTYAFPIQEALTIINQKKTCVVEIRPDAWRVLKEQYGEKYPEFFNQNHLMIFLLPPAPHILALRIRQRSINTHLSSQPDEPEHVISDIQRGLSQHWLLDFTKDEKSVVYIVNDKPARVAEVLRSITVKSGI